MTELKKINRANSWYQEAETDYISAKSLFECGQTARCVFFMQQSIELLIKGIFIECGITNQPFKLKHHPEKKIKQLYQENGDTINSENCIYVLNAVGNKTFSEKLPVICQICNSATDQYTREWLISIEGGYYLHLKWNYVNNILFCLAVLFCDTEQNSRYPDNGSTKLRYDIDEVKRYIPSLLKFLKSIIDTITYSISNDYVDIA